MFYKITFSLHTDYAPNSQYTLLPNHEINLFSCTKVLLSIYPRIAGLGVGCKPLLHIFIQIYICKNIPHDSLL